MRLPPLLSIRIFEAAGRHLSVRRAAEELCVTPGAVPQQLRKLETFLGLKLFERLPRGLALTAAGADYHRACRQALEQLRRETDRLRARKPSPIVVSCTPGFALQWLLPRIEKFHAGPRGLDVHISTTNRVVDLAREPVDFAIRHGLGPYPDLRADLLLDDDPIPACSPALVAPRRKLRLDDLRGARLLHDERRDDWRLWLAAAGLATPHGRQGVVFSDSNGVVEAALAGKGIALVRRSLIEAELADRRLICLSSVRLRSRLAYRLVYRADTLIDPSRAAFRQWLLTQRDRGGGKPRSQPLLPGAHQPAIPNCRIR